MFASSLLNILNSMSKKDYLAQGIQVLLALSLAVAVTGCTRKTTITRATAPSTTATTTGESLASSLETKLVAEGLTVTQAKSIATEAAKNVDSGLAAASAARIAKAKIASGVSFKKFSAVETTATDTTTQDAAPLLIEGALKALDLSDVGATTDEQKAQVAEIIASTSCEVIGEKLQLTGTPNANIPSLMMEKAVAIIMIKVPDSAANTISRINQFTAKKLEKAGFEPNASLTAMANKTATAIVKAYGKDSTKLSAIFKEVSNGMVTASHQASGTSDLANTNMENVLTSMIAGISSESADETVTAGLLDSVTAGGVAAIIKGDFSNSDSLMASVGAAALQGGKNAGMSDTILAAKSATISQAAIEEIITRDPTKSSLAQQLSKGITARAELVILDPTAAGTARQNIITGFIQGAGITTDDTIANQFIQLSSAGQLEAIEASTSFSDAQKTAIKNEVNQTAQTTIAAMPTFSNDKKTNLGSAFVSFVAIFNPSAPTNAGSLVIAPQAMPSHTPPAATLGAPSSTSLRSSSTATLTLTYMGAHSTSLNSTGVTLTKVSGNIPSCSINVGTPTASGATITLSNCTSTGVFTVHVNAGTAADTAGNLSLVSNESAAISVDNRTFTVGGLVTGLGSGVLILKNNGGDALTLSGSGNFTFSSALYDQAIYNVTIDTAAAGKTCTLTQATGTINAANISNVSIACDDDILVVGQPNLWTSNTNYSGQSSSSSFYNPWFVQKFGTNYYVADSSNHRVLIFGNGLSSAATAVLGHTTFTSSVKNDGKANPTGSTLAMPRQMASDGTHFAVADAANNRVLIWNQFPTQTGTAADYVIGQPDMNSKCANQGVPTSNICPSTIPNPTAQTLNNPTGVLYIGTKLLVSDATNNRILVFNSTPQQNNASADFFIGQADFLSKCGNRGVVSGTTCPAVGNPTAISLNSPMGLSLSGSKLLVGDYSNHRVLIWNRTDAAHDPLLVADLSPDVVLGQADFATKTSGNGQGAMNGPTHALMNSSELYVADGGNHRVLYYSSIPASGGNATGLVGQVNWNTGSANRGATTPAAYTFNFPRGLLIDGGALYVAEHGNNRIVKFNTAPQPTQTETALGTQISANSVSGQASFVLSYTNQQTVGGYGLSAPAGICQNDHYLVIADRGNYRYLVVDKANPAGGFIAAIGQASLTAAISGQPASATSVAGNSGGNSCAFDSQGRLYLSDTGNYRILVYNTVPTSSGAAANDVIGQGDFSSIAGACTAIGAGYPSGITIVRDASDSNKEKLIATMTLQDRVLIYNFDPNTNVLNKNAAVAIGQSNLTTCTLDQAYSATTVRRPFGVYSDGTKLFVADSAANRILVYNTIPQSDGVSANIVIGAPNTTTSTQTAANAANSFYYSASNGGYNLRAVNFTSFDGYLFVPDYYGGRIAAFELASLATGMSMTYLWGQPNATSQLSSVTGFAASDDGLDWGYFSLPTAIQEDPDGVHVWFVDSGLTHLVRARKTKFWSLKKP